MRRHRKRASWRGAWSMSGWGRWASSLCDGRQRLQAAQGLQAGLGDFGALLYKVLAVEAQVLFVLVKIARRQHGAEDGYIGVQLHAHEAVDDGGGDELVAVDAAIDDEAAGNDGVVTTAACQALGMQRDLEGAGHLEVVNLLGGNVVSLQFGFGGLGAAGDDVAVP